jgi:nitrate reductase assembly molybdenum cofactor insertion protein NarJ
MKQNRQTLRALGLLLGYPDAHLRSLLPSLVYAIDAENALSDARRAEVRAFIREMESASPIELEGRYLDFISGALRRHESRYASVLAAIVDLSGRTAQAIAVAQEDFAHG